MATIRHKTHHGQDLTLIWRPQVSVESKILIGAGTIDKLVNTLFQINAGKQVLLLLQQSLPARFLDLILPTLKQRDFSVSVLELPDGEDGKSVDHLLKLWQKLQELKFTRQDTIVAIGGGALTDIAGFAAATYLRGINFVAVPTTLLSQVDAAIGGKTAVNLPAGKNLAGTFYFAKAIIIDPQTLNTLSNEQFISGLAEIIKYALIEKTIAEQTDYIAGPKPLLSVLEQYVEDQGTEQNKSSPLLSGIITSCIKMKLAVVAKDPLELGLRRCLNLGHTLGHALEKATNYQLTHGQAVSIGIAFVLKLSIDRRTIAEAEAARALSLLHRAGLPTKLPDSLEMAKVLEALSQDKKREKQAVLMVLPDEKLGKVNYETPVNLQELEAAISTL
jgi:3-dehydroquinate synthase